MEKDIIGMPNSKVYNKDWEKQKQKQKGKIKLIHQEQITTIIVIKEPSYTKHIKVVLTIGLPKGTEVF